jgi:2-hydroxychromene-2-carboxylate isomerase
LRRAPEFAGVDFRLMPVWPEVIFGGHMDNPTDNLFKMAYIFGDAVRQAEVAGIDATTFRMLARMFPLPDDADYETTKLGVPTGEERWEVPHFAVYRAARDGKAWAFADAVFARRFNLDGQGAADVMDESVIASIAESVGIDGPAAASAWKCEEFVDEHEACVRLGERDGVFGVPFFAVDRDGRNETFWGNDRLEYLLRALRGCSELPAITRADRAGVQPYLR